MAKENESTMKWKVDVSEMKAAMADAKRSISLANAEFKAATAGMDKWSTSASGVEAKLKQLNSVLPQQKAILAELQKQYNAVAVAQGADSAEAQRLQIQIANQQAAIGKTEASIDKYNKQLGEMQAAEKQSSSALNQLNTTISTQEKELAELKNEYANAVLMYGKNSKEAKAYGKEITDLSGELEKNKTALKDAEGAADDLAKETDEAADAADKATGHFSDFGKALADAAKVGVAAFAAAVAGMVTGLASASVDAASFADEILTMSTVTGISAESLQAYSYAAELVDVSMETLNGSMKKNIQSMKNAAKGSKEYEAAYKQLGISVTDANGNLRDGEEVYWEAIDALGQMEEGTARDALAMQLFGKSAQDLNPLIAQGSEGIAALTDEAKAMGAVLSDDQLAELGTFDDSMQRIKSGAGAAKNALGLVLLPSLQMLADDGVDLLGQFTTGLLDANGDWEKISDVVGKTVGSMADMIIQQLPNIIQVGTAMVSALGGAIVDNLPMLVSAAGTALVSLVSTFAEGAPTLVSAGMEAITALITGLTEAMPELIASIPVMITGIMDAIVANLPVIIQAGMELLQALLTGIMDALPVLIDYIPELIVSLCDTITENLPEIIDMGIELLVSLLNGIIKTVPQLIKYLPKIITSICKTITENLPLIIQAGVTILLSIINGLIDALPELIEYLPEIINTIVQVITENLPTIIQAGITILIQLIQGLIKAIPQLIQYIPSIIKTIVSTLIENLPLILQAGKDILLMLIDGIGAVLGDLGEMAGRIFSTIWDKITELADSVFDIGSNIVSGIWNGISDGLQWIKDKISGWVGNVLKFIKNLFGISSPSKVMRDEIGKWLPEGMAEGFEADMPSAIKTMKESLNDALSELKTDVSVGASGLIGTVNADGTGAVGAGQVVNFNQIINSPKPVDRLTLYRETNSLLFSAKVGLANV